MLFRSGVELTVKCPVGKSYKDLEKNIDSLESSLRGIITIEDIRFTDLIKIEVINKELKNYDFIPVKSPNNMLFIGKNFSEKKILYRYRKRPTHTYRRNDRNRENILIIFYIGKFNI